MLAYYFKNTNSQNINLSTLNILENYENKIISEQYDDDDMSKKLIYGTLFSTVIEILDIGKKINIFDTNLNLINSIDLENKPIVCDIFENKLAVLFLRNGSVRNYYISIFDFDGFNINKIKEINVGHLNRINEYVLRLNQNKILYLKETQPTCHNLFLFDITTNIEYELDERHNYIFRVANLIDDYILCCLVQGEIINIYDSSTTRKVNEIRVNYEISEILVTETKIIITFFNCNIIQIYDKHLPIISILEEIDLHNLINLNFGDCNAIINIIPAFSTDELYIRYKTPIYSDKIIVFDLNTKVVKLIKEFDNEFEYVDMILYFDIFLQLW